MHAVDSLNRAVVILISVHKQKHSAHANAVIDLDKEAIYGYWNVGTFLESISHWLLKELFPFLHLLTVSNLLYVLLTSKNHQMPLYSFVQPCLFMVFAITVIGSDAPKLSRYYFSLYPSCLENSNCPALNRFSHSVQTNQCDFSTLQPQPTLLIKRAWVGGASQGEGPVCHMTWM